MDHFAHSVPTRSRLSPVVVPAGMLSFDMPRLPADQERKQQRLWLMGPSYADKFRF
jgi:hypothetical protein